MIWVTICSHTQKKSEAAAVMDTSHSKRNKILDTVGTKDFIDLD